MTVYDRSVLALLEAENPSCSRMEVPLGRTGARTAGLVRIAFTYTTTFLMLHPVMVRCIPFGDV